MVRSVLFGALAGCVDGGPVVIRDTGDTDTEEIDETEVPPPVFLLEVGGAGPVEWLRALDDATGDALPEVVAFSEVSGTSVFVVDQSGIVGQVHGVDDVAAPGDVDGDGLDDLAITVDDVLGVVHGPLTMDADAWTAATPMTPMGGDPWVGALADGRGDVDGDGRDDVVYGFVDSSYTESIGINGVSRVFDGTDADTIALLPTADGTIDIIARDGASVEVFPLSTFAFTYASALDQFSGEIRVIGDVDEDGLADLAAETSHGRFVGHVIVTTTGLVVEPPGRSVFEGQADGGADVDADGHPDVVMSWTQDGVVRAALGFGPVAAFDDLGVVVEGPDGAALTGAIALVDLNLDGHSDVALGTTDGLVVVDGLWLATIRPPLTAPPTDDAWDPCAGSPPGPRALAGGARTPLVGAVSIDAAAMSFIGDYGDVTDLGVADVDGDGNNDLIAATPHWVGSDDDTSGAVHTARTPTLGAQPLLTDDSVYGVGSSSSFGYRISAADADADGVADVLASATGEYVDGEFDGIYLLPGTPTGVTCRDDAPRFTVPGSGFVTGALLEDHNGDGAAEIVGADLRDKVSFWASPHPAGGARRDAWLEISPSDGYDLGATLSEVGDIDGDGRSEMAISESWVNQSRVHVVDPDGWSGSVIIEDVAAITWHHTLSSRLGWALSPAGDVDGDGRADVLAGAPDAESTALAWSAGQAFVLATGRSGAAEDEAMWLIEGAEGAGVGYAVAGGGDTDSDGLPEVLVGSDGSTSAWLFEDLAAGVWGPEHARATFTGVDDGYFDFGTAVALGDLDGDGLDDVIIGGDAEVGLSPVGSVWVWFGAM